MTGPIPAWLGNLANLTHLYLNSNQLTGKIPAELGKLVNLERIQLAGNQFTGCVPLGLRDVANNDFGNLDLPFCTPERAADRAALIAFYNATGGANWTNSSGWSTEAPIEQWHGVITDSTGRVTELDLEENGLTEPIPTELAQLSSLRRLSLHSNQLTGKIPSQLGSLTNLTYLNLRGNQLTGEIPHPSWRNLTNLDLPVPLR